MKNVWRLTSVIFLLTTFFNTVQAQDLADLDLMAMADLEIIEEHNTRYETKTKTEFSLEERIAKAKAYDLYVSKEFGSYLNPYNGNLYIVNNDKKLYSRAQMMNESTKEKVFSIIIDEETKPINIENYDPGEYMLILSNDKGDMLVENFIII